MEVICNEDVSGRLARAPGPRLQTQANGVQSGTGDHQLQIGTDLPRQHSRAGNPAGIERPRHGFEFRPVAHVQARLHLGAFGQNHVVIVKFQVMVCDHLGRRDGVLVPLIGYFTGTSTPSRNNA